MVIGVDLGGTKVLAGAVARDGTVRSRFKLLTQELKGQPDALLDRIAEAVRGAADEAGMTLGDARAVGMGVPGPLDLTRSVVAVAPNLGWGSLAVRSELERRLPGMRVFLENDVRAAALAEARIGSGRGHHALLAVFVGSGVGGGMVIGGRVYHGGHGTAGEIGHVVVKVDGPVCPCGRRGCFEALTARDAIIRMVKAAVARGVQTALTALVREGSLDNLSSLDLSRAVGEHDDPLASQVLKRSARYTGIAIGGLINLVDPDIVVLGGGVVEAGGQPYLEVVTRYVRRQVLSSAAAGLPVVLSTLGDESGLLGAALTAWDGLGEASNP